MKQYIVTRRPGHGLAASSPNKQFPHYRIAADTALEAQKTACRLDGQDECFCRLYIATPEKTKKHRPAATDRCCTIPEKGTVGMKTKKSISQAISKRKREV